MINVIAIRQQAEKQSVYLLLQLIIACFPCRALSACAERSRSIVEVSFPTAYSTTYPAKYLFLPISFLSFEVFGRF